MKKKTLNQFEGDLEFIESFVGKCKITKKKTLKQLEGDLEYIESFVEKCKYIVDVEKFSIAFYSSESKKPISFEDIQTMPLDTRYGMCLKHINDSDFFDGSDKEHENIHKAIRALYIMGFRDLSAAVHKMALVYSISEHYKGDVADIKHQIKQKKITSKGGKGRTSCHKDTALKIAADTWGNVPHASMESLSFKIYEYLNRNYRGVPVPGTIKEWLKASGLNPEQSPKVRDYELVVK